MLFMLFMVFHAAVLACNALILLPFCGMYSIRLCVHTETDSRASFLLLRWKKELLNEILAQKNQRFFCLEFLFAAIILKLKKRENRTPMNLPYPNFLRAKMHRIFHYIWKKWAMKITQKDATFLWCKMLTFVQKSRDWITRNGTFFAIYCSILLDASYTSNYKSVKLLQQ